MVVRKWITITPYTSHTLLSFAKQADGSLCVQVEVLMQLYEESVGDGWEECG